MKNIEINIDREVIFAYNRSMKKFFCSVWTWRVFLTLLCVLTTGFIFYNSMQTAEASSAASSGVVETVQEVATVVAPNSKIANATGKDYDLLHAFVRSMAHFSEFALLGAALVWCWRTYTAKKKFLALPFALIVGIAVTDEILQHFVAGRAAQATDVLIDVCGGLCGGGFAFLTVVIVTLMIIKKRRREYGAGEHGNRLNQV